MFLIAACLSLLIGHHTLAPADPDFFHKSPSASELMHASEFPYSLWLNRGWDLRRSRATEAREELTFVYREFELYGNLIAEPCEPTDTIEALFEKSTKGFGEVTILRREVRVVNGSRLHYFQFSIKFESEIEIISDLYLYKDETFFVALSTLTSSKLHPCYIPVIHDFLNGLRIIFC